MREGSYISSATSKSEINHIDQISPLPLAYELGSCGSHGALQA